MSGETNAASLEEKAAAADLYFYLNIMFFNADSTQRKISLSSTEMEAEITDGHTSDRIKNTRMEAGRRRCWFVWGSLVELII